MGTSPPDTGLVALLGLRFEHISADQVVISWTVDERHLQPQDLALLTRRNRAHATPAN